MHKDEITKWISTTIVRETKAIKQILEGSGYSKFSHPESITNIWMKRTGILETYIDVDAWECWVEGEASDDRLPAPQRVKSFVNQLKAYNHRQQRKLGAFQKVTE